MCYSFASVPKNFVFLEFMLVTKLTKCNNNKKFTRCNYHVIQIRLKYSLNKVVKITAIANKFNSIFVVPNDKFT